MKRRLATPDEIYEVLDQAIARSGGNGKLAVAISFYQIMEERGLADTEHGICPVCGQVIVIVGHSKDFRFIGSCGDAFTIQHWYDLAPQA